MANRQSNSPIDLATLFHTGAKTSSGAGSAGVIDLGGAGKRVGRMVVDISAIDIVSNDESYDIVVEGSPDSDFGTAANILELAAIHVGAKETKRTTSDRDDATGRRSVYFDNLTEAGTALRYARVYVVVAGTTPSITFTAHLVPVEPGV